jgi:ammonium transporter, Amt family
MSQRNDLRQDRDRNVVGVIRSRSRRAGYIYNKRPQVLLQARGVAATVIWAEFATFALLKLIGLFIPLRASKEDKSEGLDHSHGEVLQ